LVPDLITALVNKTAACNRMQRELQSTLLMMNAAQRAHQSALRIQRDEHTATQHESQALRGLVSRLQDTLVALEDQVALLQRQLHTAQSIQDRMMTVRTASHSRLACRF
jgi:hypothetical protein